MCDPTSIGLAISAIGMAASTAGSYANAQKVEAATDARNRERRDAELRSRMAQQAERDRQTAFERAQMGEQQRVLHEQATPEKVEDTTERTTADLTDQTQTALNQVLLDKLPGQGANKVINAANAQSINAGAKDLRAQLQAMAKLAAMDTTFADLGMALGQSGQRIGTIGSKRAGSARVGQAEMQQIMPDVTENRGMGPDLLIALGQTAQTAGPYAGAAFGGSYGGVHSAANRARHALAGAVDPMFAPMPVNSAQYRVPY